MRRFWIGKDKIQNQMASIDGDLFHHLTDVCRLTVGDKFELLCGDQKAYFVEIKEHTKKMAVAEVLEERVVPPLPKPYVNLAISIPRFQKLDTIIEKAVELGVKAVHPFTSDFSYVRKVDSALLERLPRWDRIVKAATQQCGRGELMEIAKPVKIEEIIENINRNSNAGGLFSYEGKSNLSIKEALQQIRGRNPDEIWVIVGSEGGFSTAEVESFHTKGFEPVTMGDQVLRVETACLALVSVIKYEFGVMI